MRIERQLLCALSLSVGACYQGPEAGADTDTEGGTGGAQTEGSGPSGPSGGSMSGGTSGGSAASTGDSTTSNPTSTTASTSSTSDPTEGTTEEPPIEGPLLDRLEVFDITVAEGVLEGVSNWRIWGRGSLHVAPVFVIPTADGTTLVGFTGSSLTPRVAVVGADGSLVSELALETGFELRGLASSPEDGEFGALLWDPSGQRIFVSRHAADGTGLWSTELTNPDNTPTDFGIGDSRLEYGDGVYGAYYHVHSDTGHEGDTLKWVDAGSGAETTGWGWGCSHSMSNVLRYNSGAGGFLPACVTDCFPGTSGDFAVNAIGGIYVNHNEGHVLDVDAGCNGDVAGELGSAALADAGWNLVFNAHQAPATLGQGSYDPASMNQDIGFARVDAAMNASEVVWLTTTDNIDEADASIARWRPTDDDSEQYVVGWHDGDTGPYQLARIDATGAFVEGPVDVTAVAQWGRRDDPFRAAANGDIVWAWFDDPGSTTLHLAKLRH